MCLSISGSRLLEVALQHKNSNSVQGLHIKIICKQYEFKLFRTSLAYKINMIPASAIRCL